MTEEELTPEEEQQLASWLNQQGSYPKPDEKAGMFHFFNKILGTQDTIRVSNLSAEELDAVRNLKRAEIYCDMHKYDKVKEYFRLRSEIITSSALSRMGFLIQAAITTKKETKARLKTGEDKKTKWMEKKEQA